MVMTKDRSPNTHLRAILCALAGFTLWVLGDMFMKLASEQHAPSHEIMAIGGIGGLISIFFVTAVRGKLAVLRPRKYLGLAALGIMFFLNYILWLKALAHLPLANFYTVLFLSPTLVAILAAYLLKEPLDWRKILAILAGFGGVVIAVNPTELLRDKDDLLSYAAVFVGMLVVVTQQLTLRFMANHESRESTAFFPRFGAILGGTVATCFYGYTPLSHEALFYSLMTGAVGGLGWVFMANAYKMAPAATVSPFHYSQIVTSAILGYLIWHDIPSAHLITGASIIILSGLYIAKHAHKTAKITATVVDTP